MDSIDMGRKGGRATSAAKTAANRLKMKAFWRKVRNGDLPSPRRHRIYPEAIQSLARRYIWWLPPSESLALRSRVVAQVMDIGTMEDCAVIKEYFGVPEMGIALRRAQPGWFRPRSWTYWHYRLGLTPWGNEPPPMPTRVFSD
jgi:hypothetical protein